MLTQVVIESSTPMTLDIESVDPDEILILTSVSGLSSAGASPFIGELARDGGYYQGRRAERRNPVFNFRLNEDYVNEIDVSDIREMLYRTFMEPLSDSDGVRAVFKDTTKPDRYMIGYTEKIESDLFEKSTMAQISMLCTDPYLRSVEETVGNNVGGWLATPVHYLGTADTGLEMDLKVYVDTPRISVQLITGVMVLDYPFKAGDTISINTNQGSRWIRCNDEDIMTALTSSLWLRLKVQDDMLRVYGQNPGDGKVALTQYRYRAAWWGI